MKKIEKKPPSLYSKIVYAILVILLLMIFWPGTRAILQRGLMKIGLYKPPIETFDAAIDSTAGDAAGYSNQNRATFVDEHGRQTNTADLKNKVVFMNFWATWCGPCVAEMPSIQSLYDEFSDRTDAVFMLIEIERDMDLAKQFMAKHNLNMPVYVPIGSIPNEWMSGAIPSTVVLDKQGREVFSHRGMSDYSDPKFIDFIREQLDK